MNTELRKRLEINAEFHASRVVPYDRLNREELKKEASGDFIAGGEWMYKEVRELGYKEAIGNMVQYLQRDYAYNASMAIHDEAFIADFEAEMNKLFKEN